MYVAPSFVSGKHPSRVTIHRLLRSSDPIKVWEGLSNAPRMLPLDGRTERLVANLLTKRPFVDGVSTVAAQVLGYSTGSESQSVLASAFADAMNDVPRLLKEPKNADSGGGPISLRIAALSAEALYRRRIRRPASVLSETVKRLPPTLAACVVRIVALSQFLPIELWSRAWLLQLATVSNPAKRFALYILALRGDRVVLRECRTLARGPLRARIECIALLHRIPARGELREARNKMLLKLARAGSLAVRVQAVAALGGSAPREVIVETVRRASNSHDPETRRQGARLLNLIPAARRARLGNELFANETDPVVRAEVTHVSSK